MSDLQLEQIMIFFYIYQFKLMVISLSFLTLFTIVIELETFFICTPQIFLFTNHLFGEDNNS